MEVIINGYKFKVYIKRCNNKNMYLRVKEDGLYVSANFKIKDQDILRFINSKQDWIIKAFDKRQKRVGMLSKGVDAPIIYLLGEKKFVNYKLSKRNFLEVNNDIVTFNLKEIDDLLIQKTFSKYAKSKLEEILNEKRKRWDRLIIDYKITKEVQIKIRSMTSRWGSCMVNKGVITMNLSLIHFPVECIDYVLLHEYTHLIVPNHSKRFYDVIKYNMPDYKNYINMLK
ncbi:MAG: M48 family metallopeptidase [Anaerorhabdus sp.]